MGLDPATGYRLQGLTLLGRHAEFCRIPERTMHHRAAGTFAPKGSPATFDDWTAVENKAWGWLLWTGNRQSHAATRRLNDGSLNLTEVNVIDPTRPAPRNRTNRLRMLRKKELGYLDPTHPAVFAALLVEVACNDTRFGDVLAPLLPGSGGLLFDSSAGVSGAETTSATTLPEPLLDLLATLDEIPLSQYPMSTALTTSPSDHFWSGRHLPSGTVDELYQRAITVLRLRLPPAPSTPPPPEAPRTQVTKVTAPPAVGPVPDLLSEAVALHAEVDAEWTEFCADPYSVFIRPLINDVTEPATAAFFQRREAADYLAPSAVARPTPARTAEYHQAVLDLSDARSAADTNARSVGLTRMDTATKRTLNRARSALNRALDERTPAAERRICCDLIVQLLGDVAAVPEPMRHRLIHQIETTRPQLPG